MSLVNFHQALPSKYHTERTTYPNYDRVRIDIPCMMSVIGSTGSGKTNAVLNIIQHINCWTKIYLFAKNFEEPLYAFLIDKLKAASRKLREPIIMAENDIDKLPAVSDIDKAQTNLLIVDDMITEKSKQLQRVAEYWIRGRKQNCTCIFISQSYYDIPLLIRKNTQYFAFLKINTLGDLKRIVKECSLGVTPKDMLDMYRSCTAGHMQSFFLIDVVTNDPRYRFRKNFTPLTHDGDGLDDLIQPTATQRRRRIDADEGAVEDDDGVPIVSNRVHRARTCTPLRSSVPSLQACS